MTPTPEEIERLAALRVAMSGRTRYEGLPERTDEFLLRLYDDALRLLADTMRERDEALEMQAIAEGLLRHALLTATPTWDAECQELARRAIERHAGRLAPHKEPQG